MAILKKDQSQSSHWYKADGTPCHRLPRTRGGGLRPTTLRDARRLQLFPSVTSILGIFAKPQLDKWKMRQVAHASMRLDRTEGESDDYFADRIIEEAFAQVEQAADLGSRIHDAIDKHFDGDPIPDDLVTYISPVLKWKEAKDLEFVERELRVVNKAHGFAGTMDVACVKFGSGEEHSKFNVERSTFDVRQLSRQSAIGVVDFKTRKTKPGVAVTPYDGQAMQIAAYGATYWGEENLPRMFGANAYISTTEPGRLEVCSYTPQQLMAEWEVFKMACAIWRHSKNYDPRSAQLQQASQSTGGTTSVSSAEGKEAHHG